MIIKVNKRKHCDEVSQKRNRSNQPFLLCQDGWLKHFMNMREAFMQDFLNLNPKEQAVFKSPSFRSDENE
jgi:hypothetical protein